MSPDDGSPDPALSAALASWDGTAASSAQVLAALVGARVFLALAARAVSTEVGPSGLRQESAAEMALISLVSAGGARALPAFADGREVQRWRAEARPVPVSGPRAGSTALDDGAAALLLDPLGAAVVVPAALLPDLAAGRVPVVAAGLGSPVGPATAGTAAGLSSRTVAEAPHEPAVADPALVAALARALRGEPVRAARLLAGADGPVLGVVADLGPADLTALAARLRARLGAALPADGLDLAVVPADGPGLPVPRRSWRPWSRRT